MKTTQSIKLFLSLLIFLPACIFAQERRDRIETMHIAYLSQKLSLTSIEAEKFWPIYNEYKAGQDQLRKERQQETEAIMKAGGVDNMSDGEVHKLIDNEVNVETRQLDLRKQYVVKFQQAIPIRKVAKFFIAEEEFKRFLLNQLGKRMGRGGRDMGDNDRQGLQ